MPWCNVLFQLPKLQSTPVYTEGGDQRESCIFCSVTCRFAPAQKQDETEQECADLMEGNEDTLEKRRGMAGVKMNRCLSQTG